jgi:thiol-disulfide isomerase/thioredoxin
VLSLDLSTLYENNTDPISGTGSGPNADHESSVIRTTALTARYTASPRLAWTLAVPYRSIRSPKDVGGSSAKHIDRSFRGLGDTILLARYQLDPAAPNGGGRVYTLAGVRLPTGSANPNHIWRASDGSLILSRDAVLQPGFGTYDPIVGFQWTPPRSSGRTLYLGALYRHTSGTNGYGYKYGHEFQLTAGASVPMGRNLTFSPALFGQFSGHDRDYDPLPGKHRGVVSNTGGRWLYFIPTLRYGNVELNVQLPVYRKTNGNILNPDVILVVRMSRDLPLTRSARIHRRQRSLPKGITPGAGDFQVISRGERLDLRASAVPGKITLVEFVSRHCLACRAIAPELTALLSRRSDVAVRQIDITAPSAPAAVQYGIEATPAFFVLAQDGTQVNEEPMGFDEVRSWLEKQAAAGAGEVVQR